VGYIKPVDPRSAESREASAWRQTRQVVDLSLRLLLREAEEAVLYRYYEEVFAPAIEQGEIRQLDVSVAQLRDLLADEVVKLRQSELEAGNAAVEGS
jgi:hypothetical protein